MHLSSAKSTKFMIMSIKTLLVFINLKGLNRASMTKGSSINVTLFRKVTSEDKYIYSVPSPAYKIDATFPTSATATGVQDGLKLNPNTATTNQSASNS